MTSNYINHIGLNHLQDQCLCLWNQVIKRDHAWECTTTWYRNHSSAGAAHATAPPLLHLLLLHWFSQMLLPPHYLHLRSVPNSLNHSASPGQKWILGGACVADCTCMRSLYVPMSTIFELHGNICHIMCNMSYVISHMSTCLQAYRLCNSMPQLSYRLYAYQLKTLHTTAGQVATGGKKKEMSKHKPWRATFVSARGRGVRGVGLRGRESGRERQGGERKDQGCGV